jgi:hypothetical protein
MTEPRTFEFKARWADGNGSTEIEVGPVPGPEVRVNVGGYTDGAAEVLISTREAVKLAHALLTIAAPTAGIVKQFVTGASFMGSDPGPARTIWLLDAEPLA